MNKKSAIPIFIIAFVILVIIKGLSWWNTGNAATAEKFRDVSHLILTKHAKCRMDCRQITLDEIHEILQKGKVNYSKSKPSSMTGDSTFALEGYSRESQHIRVVVAPENDGLVLITCIDLNKDWPCDCD